MVGLNALREISTPLNTDCYDCLVNSTLNKNYYCKHRDQNGNSWGTCCSPGTNCQFDMNYTQCSNEAISSEMQYTYCANTGPSKCGNLTSLIYEASLNMHISITNISISNQDPCYWGIYANASWTSDSSIQIMTEQINGFNIYIANGTSQKLAQTSYKKVQPYRTHNFIVNQTVFVIAVPKDDGPNSFSFSFMLNGTLIENQVQSNFFTDNKTVIIIAAAIVLVLLTIPAIIFIVIKCKKQVKNNKVEPEPTLKQEQPNKDEDLEKTQEKPQEKQQDKHQTSSSRKFLKSEDVFEIKDDKGNSGQDDSTIDQSDVSRSTLIKHEEHNQEQIKEDWADPYPPIINKRSRKPIKKPTIKKPLPGMIPWRIKKNTELEKVNEEVNQNQ